MKRLLVVFLFMPSMAFGAFTEFYCQTTGSNLNAGSTNADAAAFTYASGSWVASTGVFTVASGNPSGDGVAVGDFASVYPDGSTVGVFVGRVTARTTTTITVSLTAKGGTAPTDGTSNRTLKIGGAWKGPNAAEAFPFGFATGALTDVSARTPRVNFKNSATYSISSAITHSGGVMMFQGYASSPGDGGKATLDGGSNAILLLTLSGAQNAIGDFIFSNNGSTGTSDGLLLNGARQIGFRIVAHDIRGDGIVLGGGFAGMLVESEAYNCNTANTAGDGGIKNAGNAVVSRTIAHDNPGSNNAGFVSASMSGFFYCIADSNGLYGFSNTGGGGMHCVGCDAYNNGGDGFRAGATSGSTWLDNVNAIKNGGFGINFSGFAHCGGVLNPAFGSGTQANTSGESNFTATAGNFPMVGNITYASNVSPYVDAPNGDFRINLAAAKGAGRGAFTQTASSYAGTIAYPDIGAAQHQETGKETSHVFAQ